MKLAERNSCNFMKFVKETSIFGVLAFVLFFMSGCGALTGLPGHGAGNLFGGRYSIISQLRGDYVQSPPTVETSRFPRYTSTSTSRPVPPAPIRVPATATALPLPQPVRVIRRPPSPQRIRPPPPIRPPFPPARTAPTPSCPLPIGEKPRRKAVVHWYRSAWNTRASVPTRTRRR